MKELVVKLIVANAKTKCKSTVYEEIITIYIRGKNEKQLYAGEKSMLIFRLPAQKFLCLRFPND